MRRPSTAGRWVLAAAAATWIGALTGGAVGTLAALPVLVAALVTARRSPRAAVLVVLLAAGTVSGGMAAARVSATLGASVTPGSIDCVGVVVEDSSERRPGVLRPEARRRAGEWTVWQGPALAVETPPGAPVIAGWRIRVRGTLRAAPGMVRGDPVAGRIGDATVTPLAPVGGPLFAAGNAVRRRVRGVLDLRDPAEALISGFLIGDTSGMSRFDLEALRRSGLTHFVAVSGSNVVLFLGAWWILTAVLGTGPVRRFVFGIVGLGVFVVATRWEASVLRAAFMASVVLASAAAGVNADAWVAIGAATTLLLLVAGQLASDVGFQLSVAATLGIMVGAGMFADRTPRMLWGTLGAAVSAQVAVVPVLLWHFGTVPLMSPVANLLAAPLVTAATIAGTAAVVTGWDAATALASIPASGVLAVARLAARWPQLGPAGVAAASAVAMGMRHRRTRPASVAVVTVMLAVTVLGGSGVPSEPTVTFLDIGQGDAVLLRDPDGVTVLVDGGRDPTVLDSALRRHRVGRIDLLVATHGDIDHVGGFDGITRRHLIGRLWVPDEPDLGGELVRLLADADRLGIPVDHVRDGVSYTTGRIRIETLGPRRRYLTRNDGSIVLWVSSDRTLLLPGDIEAVAQRELPALHPDILLVPHHGSGSTDPAWLTRTVGDVAVISVGPNTYGHPAPETLAVLKRLGVEPRVTMDEGDVTFSLADG